MSTTTDMSLLDSMLLTAKLADANGLSGIGTLLRKAIAEIEMLRSRLDHTVRMEKLKPAEEPK